MIGLGVTAEQLASQSPGQQPSFITGSYPGATWNTYDSDNNGYGVYLPYDVVSLCASQPASCGQYGVLNQQVEDQFSAALLSVFPAMAAGESTPSAYCAANPSAEVCGGAGGKGVAPPASATWQSYTPPPQDQTALAPVAAAAGVSGENVGSSAGSSASAASLPSWIWLVGAAAVAFMVMKR